MSNLRATPNSMGYYSTVLPPGTYTIETNVAGLTQSPATVSVGYGDTATESTIYLLPDSATINGTVTVETGSSDPGLSGVTATLYDTFGNEIGAPL